MTMHAAERPMRRYVRPPVPIEFPSEEKVPEGKRHFEIRTFLYQIVKLNLGAHALVGSDQFVYWDARDPKANVAPDVFVRTGAPDEYFASWKTWERGAPHVAVEIVSPSDTYKGPWADKLARYHHLGVVELVRFDREDAERPLRIWDYTEGDLVERELRPGAPAECGPLGLWWVVSEIDGLGPVLRLARDEGGTDLLPAPEDARRTAEAERDAALERVRALEEQLAKRS